MSISISRSDSDLADRFEMLSAFDHLDTGSLVVHIEELHFDSCLAQYNKARDNQATSVVSFPR